MQRSEQGCPDDEEDELLMKHPQMSIKLPLIYGRFGSLPNFFVCCFFGEFNLWASP